MYKDSLRRDQMEYDISFVYDYRQSILHQMIEDNSYSQYIATATRIIPQTVDAMEIIE
jgi:hypothetical protein